MPRRATWVLWASLALAAAACLPGSGLTPTPGPGSSTIATPGASPTPGASAPTPSAPPSAAPSASAPAPSTACPATEQPGPLPSDHLVDVTISSTSTDDLVTFVFAPSPPGPGGPPSGTVAEAQPPFSYAGSGLPIELTGEHAVQVRFSGMTIASETGEAIYAGPTDLVPNLPALREAIEFDASEGIIGWYIGYDGPGCVTLGRDGNDLTLMIAHP